MRDQKGYTNLVVAIIIMVILLGGLIYVRNVKKNEATPAPASQQTAMTQPTSTPQANSVPEINNPSDLNTVSNQLDNTNIDDLNTGLSQNDSDSSSF